MVIIFYFIIFVLVGCCFFLEVNVGYWCVEFCVEIVCKGGMNVLECGVLWSKLIVFKELRREEIIKILLCMFFLNEELIWIYKWWFFIIMGYKFINISDVLRSKIERIVFRL